MKKLNIDKEFLQLYHKGFNDSQIARELKVGHVSIKRIRERMSLESIFKYKRSFDTKVFKVLWKEGKNDTEIAEILNVSSSTIQNYRISINLSKNYNSYEETILTYEEEQVLIGGLLGDSYLQIPKSRGINATGMFAHTTEKQKEYCLYKYNILKRFCREPYDTYQDDKRTKKRYYKTICIIYTNPVFNSYFHSFYPIKSKIVPIDQLNKLDGLGLAIWFMDDGMKIGYGYGLSTNSFSIKCCENIKNFFKIKFDIDINVWKNNVCYIKTNSAQKFRSLIEPYVIETMKYKL